MSLRETSADVGSQIIAITVAISQQLPPETIAVLSSLKKQMEAEHTIMQMAYGASTG